MKIVKQFLVEKVAVAAKLPLTLIDVDFDVPLKMSNGSPRNTSVKVFTKPWISSYGSWTVAYDRIHQTEVRPIVLLKGNATTVHELMEEINYKYGFDFEVEDLVDSPLPAADTNGVISFYLQFTDRCLGCYHGTVVRTTGEHSQPMQPLPTPPENPNEPTPTIYPYPSANTLVRTECRGSDLWAFRSTGDSGNLTATLQQASSPDCQALTLRASKTQDTISGITAVNYTFNKEIPNEIKLTYTVTPGTGMPILVPGFEYKTRDSDLWITPVLGNTITLPKDTRSFYVRYSPLLPEDLPEEGLTLEFEITEQLPGNQVTIPVPLTLELTVVPKWVPPTVV